MDRVSCKALLLGVTLAGLTASSPAWAQSRAAASTTPPLLAVSFPATCLDLRPAATALLRAHNNGPSYRDTTELFIPQTFRANAAPSHPTGAGRLPYPTLASAAFLPLKRPQDQAAQDATQDKEGRDDLVELAMQVENPLAALAKVPFYNNFQFGTGPENNFRYQLNIQPVFPVSINRDWKLISRTIALVISQNNIFANSGSQFGLGDTTQSFFFAPKRPIKGGFHWGVGPAFLLPTGTDGQLSSRKWGIGPTVSVVKQENGVFYGFLTHQIWSIAGDDRYSDTSQMFLQLTYSRTDKKALTLGLNAEITANWKNGQWTVPLYFLATKVFQFGNQRMSLGGGVGWFIEHPDSTADWALRLIVTFLPKR